MPWSAVWRSANCSRSTRRLWSISISIVCRLGSCATGGAIGTRGSGLPRSPRSDVRQSAARVEIAQIGRRLVLLHRHQETVGAEGIGLAADADLAVGFPADRLVPG